MVKLQQLILHNFVPYMSNLPISLWIWMILNALEYMHPQSNTESLRSGKNSSTWITTGWGQICRISTLREITPPTFGGRLTTLCLCLTVDAYIHTLQTQTMRIMSCGSSTVWVLNNFKNNANYVFNTNKRTNPTNSKSNMFANLTVYQHSYVYKNERSQDCSGIKSFHSLDWDKMALSVMLKFKKSVVSLNEWQCYLGIFSFLCVRCLSHHFQILIFDWLKWKIDRFSYKIFFRFLCISVYLLMKRTLFIFFFKSNKLVFVKIDGT